MSAMGRKRTVRLKRGPRTILDCDGGHDGQAAEQADNYSSNPIARPQIGSTECHDEQPPQQPEAGPYRHSRAISPPLSQRGL